MSEYTVQYDDEFEQYYVSNEFKRLLGNTEVCTLLNKQVKRIAELEAELEFFYEAAMNSLAPPKEQGE